MWPRAREGQRSGNAPEPRGAGGRVARAMRSDRPAHGAGVRMRVAFSRARVCKTRTCTPPLLQISGLEERKRESIMVGFNQTKSRLQVGVRGPGVAHHRAGVEPAPRQKSARWEHAPAARRTAA